MKINFVKTSKKTIFISIVFCIFSIISIVKYNLNLGLEFTGGIEIELESNNKLDISEIRNKLSNIEDLKIKYYGSKKNLQIKIKDTGKNTDEIGRAHLVFLVKPKAPENSVIPILFSL